MTQAFGMLYQWGRKDPFPPLRHIASEYQDYNDEHTDLHYDNSNQVEVHKTSAADETKLFHSVIGSTLTGAVRHAIANPTVLSAVRTLLNKMKLTYKQRTTTSIMATGVRPEKATTNFGADWNRPPTA